jgi:hypothetical protein
LLGVVFSSPLTLLQERTDLIKEIRALTRDIADLPYHPYYWRERGLKLLRLGYPELALGDIYKARLLLEAGTRAAENFEGGLGENVLLVWGFWTTKLDFHWDDDPETAALLARLSCIATMMLFEMQVWQAFIETLAHLDAPTEFLRYVREGKAKLSKYLGGSEAFNADKEFFESRLEIGESWVKLRAKTTHSDGGTLARPYPWMTKDMLFRDETVIKSVQLELNKISEKVVVSPSEIGQVKAISTSTDHHLGLFASKDIFRHETLFVDRGPTCVTFTTAKCESCCDTLFTNARVTTPCCGLPFCRPSCLNRAMTTYHPAVYGQNFSFVRTTATDPSDDIRVLQNFLLIRYLALSITEGSSHPLKSSLMRRLRPDYTTTQPYIFNPTDDLFIPIRILQTLGIDVFADAAYDTWVLQTMRFRILTNTAGDQYDGKHFVLSCLPFYTLVNHSCQPNIGYEVKEGGWRTVVSKKRICKGDELVASYIGDTSGGRKKRQEALEAWFKYDCECKKCNKERKAEVSP